MAEVYVNNIWTEGEGEKSPWQEAEGLESLMER